MGKIMNFINGYRTYIVAGTIGILGVLQGLNVFEIPESAWLILGAFGLGFLRAGVNSIAKTIKETKK